MVREFPVRMGGRTIGGGLAALTLAWIAVPAVAKDAEEAPALTREAVEGAALAQAGDTGEAPKTEASKGSAAKRPVPALIKAQVLLDRARFSPGAIDGRDGDNLRGAIAAFAAANGLKSGGALEPDLAAKLQATSTDPVLVDYTLSEADVAGPFADRIPPKMEDQADLEALGYTSAREMLAERFHMSPDLLSALNPGADFAKAGTVLQVAAVAPLDTSKPKSDAATKEKSAEAKDVTRIEVDKTSRNVRSFDKAGRLVAYYPASIGSEEKPAPSGKAKVEGVAFVPTYTYNPKYEFAGVKAKTKFTIPPGPNNPVGIVWIDLSIPSYGIHGTPEPEKVGKTESHGCIRLTNWDARDLATHVARGAEVVFKDE